MRRRGLTLMEVLVSIALLLVLSSVIFAFLRDVLASRERVVEVTAQQRVASTIIERIERQAIFSLVGDSQFGSGIAGDESSLTILSRSVAISETAHADTWHKAFYDLLRTEFRFDESSHTLRVREQVPVIDAGDDAPNGAERNNRNPGNAETQYESFGSRLYKLRFRYHDGVAWQSRYDSLDAGELPRAIEIAIWFDPWPGLDWNEDEPELFDDFDDEPERLTFDMEGVFDEVEYATRADRDFRPDPPPDRIRIIAIPDAAEDAFDAPLDEEGVM